MRLVCKVCGGFRSHNKDAANGGWVCQVCKTHREGPDKVTGASNGDTL